MRTIGDLQSYVRTTPPSPNTPPTALLEDEIAHLAYRYHEEEGRPDGQANEHWHRDEQVLRGIVPPWIMESGAGAA